MRVGNFSNVGDLKILGEVRERASLIQDGLILGLPFDNSLGASNYLGATLCDNILSDGSEWVLPVDKPIFSDEGTYFNGNNTCFLRTQRDDKYNFTIHDTLTVEVDFCVDDLRECAIVSQYSDYNYASRYTFRISLLSGGRLFGSVGACAYYPTEYQNAGWSIECNSDDIKVEAGIWYTAKIVYDKVSLRLYLDNVLVGSVNALSDTTKADANGIIHNYRRRELLTSVYAGCYFIGADGCYVTNMSHISNVDNEANSRVPAWSGRNCFKGYIKNLKIFKTAECMIGDESLLFDDIDNAISEGVYVGDTITNLGHLESKSVGVYNNYKVESSLEKLDETFMGYPIWRLGMIVANAEHLSSFRYSFHSHGIYASSFLHKANTEYCTSIYYRGVNKDDIVVGGTASNIGRWSDVYREEKIRDGWKRVVTRRSADTADKIDSKHWSFICPSIELNEWVYVDWAGQLFEEGKNWSGKFTESTSVRGVLKYANAIRESGSICFSFKKNVLVDTGYHMPFRVANNILELNIRSNRFLLHSDAKYASLIRVGEWHHATMVWDKTANTLKIYLDGELMHSMGCPSYLHSTFNHEYPNMYIGCGDDSGNYAFNGYIKDFYIYDKALSESEIKKLSNSRFSVDSKGNLSLNKLSEGLNHLPDGSVYFQLGEHTKDNKRFYESEIESNIDYKDNAVGIFNASRNLCSYVRYGNYENGTGTFERDCDFKGLYEGLEVVKIQSAGGNYGLLPWQVTTTLILGKYTMSVYVYMTEGTYVYLYHHWNVWVGGKRHYIQKNKWVRLSLTVNRSDVDGSTSAGLQFFTDGTIYVTAPQYESGEYMTNYAIGNINNGDRGKSELTYDLPDILSNDKSWSVMCVAKANKSYMKSVNTQVILFAVGDYYVENKADAMIARFNATDSNRNFIGIVGFVNKAGHYTRNLTLSDEDMDKSGLYCMRYNHETNLLTFNLMTNTTNTKTTHTVDLVGLTSKLRVGNYSWQSGSWESYIKDLVVVPKCISDEELSGIYKSMMNTGSERVGVKNQVIEGADLNG